jgi:uncharacterized protein YjiS (DUF1127 family)
MAYINSTRAADYGLRARLTAALDSLSDRYTRYRVYRQTVTELGRLSARDLADLGIHRSAIHSVALEAAYGK